MSDEPPSEFLEPWFAPAADNLAAMEAELARELRPNLRHPLHSVNVRAVARRQDRDDVPTITDSSLQSRGAETDPEWPATALFASWSQWIESMTRDHEDWNT